jgi:hypothetical protein
MSRPIIDFNEPPATGTVIAYFKGRTLTLLRVMPYVRLNGSQAHLLEWKADDGRLATSDSAPVAWPGCCPRSIAENLVPHTS